MHKTCNFLQLSNTQPHPTCSQRSSQPERELRRSADRLIGGKITSIKMINFHFDRDRFSFHATTQQRFIISGGIRWGPSVVDCSLSDFSFQFSGGHRTSFIWIGWVRWKYPCRDICHLQMTNRGLDNITESYELKILEIGTQLFQFNQNAFLQA